MREDVEAFDQKEEELPSATGGCLCGEVRYRIFGPLRDVINCHCGQCLRTHGHFAAYTQVKRAAFDFVRRQGLRWFDSSDSARRGFCKSCGASLFWERRDGDSISVSAGSLDQPCGLKTTHDIFVSDKGDYYELAPGTEVTLDGGLRQKDSPADTSPASSRNMASLPDGAAGDTE